MAPLLSRVFFLFLFFLDLLATASKLLEIPKSAEFHDSQGSYHLSQLVGLTIASSTVNGTREF